MALSSALSCDRTAGFAPKATVGRRGGGAVRPAIDAKNGLREKRNMKIDVAGARARAGSRYPKPFDEPCRFRRYSSAPHVCEGGLTRATADIQSQRWGLLFVPQFRPCVFQRRSHPGAFSSILNKTMVGGRPTDERRAGRVAARRHFSQEILPAIAG